MKKLVCAIITACLLTGVVACAESMLFTSGATEARLEAMIPVLDSLAVTLNVGADEAETPDAASPLKLTYNTADTGLVWKTLRNMANQWLTLNPEYARVDQTENVATISGQVMDACAAATFQGLMIAPMQPPAEDQADGMFYDESEDAYVVTLTPADGHYLVIERNAQDGDAMVVNCGLFQAETDARLGGMTARLVAAAPDAMFPYVVADAHAEQSDDFNGLWANYCSIRYVAPEATPTPKPTATPTPKPTATRTSSGSRSSSTGTAYRRLSQGSSGDDVKSLQKRLNTLGYECGNPDGIFGKGTKSAVENFQEALGEDQDGVATAALQKKLYSSSAPKYSAYSKLKRGASGSRVEKLQKRLRELGYTAHPVDGDFDSRIEVAVSMFQYSADLDVTGEADSETQKAMNKSTAPYCEEYIDLEKGDSGFRVTEMQNQLVYLGYLSQSTEKYDSDTVTAVANFKEDYRLPGNGKSASAEVIRMMFDATSSESPVEDQPTGDDDDDEPPVEDQPAGDDDDDEPPVEDQPADDDDDVEPPVEEEPSGDDDDEQVE